ncbi:IS3 family transposase [Anaerovorax odorimutans]
MDDFWDILKRADLYGKKLTSKESILEMIKAYIEYYNHKRLQRILGVLTQ